MLCARSASPAPLLEDVRQLVSQQRRSLARARRVAPCGERDLLAARERPRAMERRQRRGLAIGVHAHRTQVLSEAHLHGLTDPAIKRLPR